ncbi:penicillin acylase family protein [Agromyces sp. LHK192]|uniref:penicillin acylase family protein n=1 Tax=Agromyces sp. LHK192 TaxID=2498704 RepID=UPI000FD8D829|nr:penicillin acylase family protein [Agromyces sp. LHK192]
MPRAELFRDRLGIPHLRAGDELALAEAQGRATALDRAWQIEVDRWRAEGRLAEHLGAAGVEWDRFARRVRLADTAQRVYDALAPADRDWVDAYVRGVNGGLREGRRAAPEFAALDAAVADETDAPPWEPWEPWAPIGVFLVAHVLFSPFPNLLWRAHVARALGPAAVARFTPGAAPAGAGSNAWAVHGLFTDTGAPLLAGDPHRLLELPGVYQQVRLACPEYDVVGLAFPGVPGIQHFGHTGYAAWGITNAIAHSVDVFAERLREPGAGAARDAGPEALGPDGWEPVESAYEHIVVRGGEPIEVRVLTTARGPLVVEGEAGGVVEHDGDTVRTGYSLAMPARIEADAGFAAFRRLLRSRSADDVAAAFEHWSDPVNRVVAADVDGTVIRFTAGRVPDRAKPDRELPLDAARYGLAPVRSTTQPPEPVADVAVDANEHPAGRPAADLGLQYANDARARRIGELLDQQIDPQDDTGLVGSVSLTTCARIHADTVSLRGLALAARLEPLRGRARTGAGRDLARRLLAWDGDLAADSADALAFTRWRAEIVRQISAAESLRPLHAAHGMGAIFDPWFSVSSRVNDALESLLEASELGIDGEAVLVDALEAVAAAADLHADAAAGAPTGAVADAHAGAPSTWGDVHLLHPLHVLADVPEAAAAAPALGAVQLAGDGDTVRCTGSVPGVTPLGYRGSVARWIWDLSDRERSRWGVPFGASGIAGHPHFDDQLTDWAVAGTTQVVTDWNALEPEEWR